MHVHTNALAVRPLSSLRTFLYYIIYFVEFMRSCILLRGGLAALTAAHTTCYYYCVYLEIPGCLLTPLSSGLAALTATHTRCYFWVYIE